MEAMIFIILGLIGLATSTAMLYFSYQPNDTKRNVSVSGREEFFNRIKVNANRMKQVSMQ